MKPGTPGFQGGRLREAREVRGLTAVALHELAEISPQAISQYENGHSSPRPEVLSTLADKLNFPEHFFMLPEREHIRGTIFYRSMSSATKAARRRAEHRFVWLRDITHYLTEFVALPEPNIPDLGLPNDPLLLSDDEIEDAAGRLRSHWGMQEGPISNMVLLLENQGAIVARDNLGAETLDSISEFAADDGRPYIILGTDKGTPARWRFDAAHELGHLVLHSHVSPQQVGRAEHFKKIEEQAHRFAAAFLLPLSAFGEELVGLGLDQFASLKPRWKVSIAMMVMRSRHGGFLSEESEKRLWINYSRRGWRRNEPFDDTMEPEVPRLLRRAFELVLGHGEQSPDDVVNRLGLPAADVEALAGLPEGFLSRFSRVELRNEGQSSDDHGGAEVVPLRPRRPDGPR